jgi:hypothetical protein
LQDLIRLKNPSKEESKEGEKMEICVDKQQVHGLLQKLVDPSIWRHQKLNIIDIADIFNYLGEMLSNWKEIQESDDLSLILLALYFITTSSTDAFFSYIEEK